MGIQDREYQKKISLAQEKNALLTLVSVNLVLFVILIFIRAIFYFQHNEAAAIQAFETRVLPWFSLPAEGSELINKPWTLILHMFVHTGVWQILGNMLWLWLFGHVMLDLTGNRKIFPVYFYGGLAGGIAFVLALNFLPGLHDLLPGATTMGASASIMAIAAAVTSISPGYRILPTLGGGIPIWVVTIAYLIIDMGTIPRDYPVLYISHLAGALAGFLFVVFFRRGIDLGGWINQFIDWISNLFDPEKPAKGKNIKEELFYRSHSKPYKKTPNITEQRVDQILDKINQKGYESLTEEEKELLNRASRE